MTQETLGDSKTHEEAGGPSPIIVSLKISVTRFTYRLQAHFLFIQKVIGLYKGFFHCGRRKKSVECTGFGPL